MRMWEGLLSAFSAPGLLRAPRREEASSLPTRLTRLAAWPRVMPADIRGLVQEVLEQSALVFGAPRTLLAWEDADEPWLRLATMTNGAIRIVEESPAKYDPLVDERLWGINFFCLDASDPSPAVSWSSSSGNQNQRFRPVHDALRRDYSITSVLSLKLDGETIQGHLLVLDLPTISREDLLIGDLMVNLIGSRMDQLSYKLSQREAVHEERIRVARDLHDGLLQSFTGVVLQLETAHELTERDPEEARRLITQLQGVMMSEQRELRTYVDELRPRVRSVRADFDFRGRLDDLRDRFRNEWRVNVDYQIGNMSPLVADSLGQETFRLIAEAVTNSAKHGQASAVEVRLFTADDRLHLSVRDDGIGFPFRGRYTLEQLTAMHHAPASLGSRVLSLNGDLTIESTDSGAQLNITVPLGMRGA